MAYKGKKKQVAAVNKNIDKTPNKEVPLIEEKKEEGAKVEEKKPDPITLIGVTGKTEVVETKNAVSIPDTTVHVDKTGQVKSQDMVIADGNAVNEKLPVIPTVAKVIDPMSALKNLHTNDLGKIAEKTIIVVNNTGEQFQPLFVDKFYSGFTLTSTEQMRNLKLEYTGVKIGAFSDNFTFLKAYVKLLEDVIEKYNGIPKGIQEVENPVEKRGRTTAPESIGLNLFGHDSVFNARDKRLLYDGLSRLDNDKLSHDKHRAFRLQYSILHPAERELHDALSFNETTLIRQDLIALKHELFKQLDDQYQFAVSMDKTQDLRFIYDTKTLRTSVGFDQLVERNTFIQYKIVEDNRAVIQAAISFISESVREMSTTLLANYRVSATRHGLTNSIPAEVSTNKAVVTAYGLLTVAANRRYSQLIYRPAMDKIDIMVLFDCISLKLTTPAYLYSVKTRNYIDNYIYFYLILYLVAYENLQRVTYDDIMNSNVNYLTLCFDDGELTPAADLALRPFLYSDDNGSGWLNCGMNQYKTLPEGLEEFFNTRDGNVWYPYYSGVPVNGPANVQQFENFRLFCAFLIEQRSMRGEGMLREYQTTLSATLRIMLSYANNIGYMVHSMDRRLRKLCLIGTMFPERPSKSTIETTETTHKVYLDKFGPFCSLLLINWTEETNIMMDRKFIERAWVMHQGFDEFCFKHQFIKSRSDKVHTSSAEIIRQAIDSVKTNVGLREMLNDVLFLVPNTKSVSIPLVAFPYLHQRYVAAERFVKRMEHYMGYASHFYYFGDAKSTPDIYHNVKYIADPDYKGEMVVMNRNDLMDVYRTKQFVQFIRNAKDKKILVRFDIPINVTTTVTNGQYLLNVPFDYTVASGSVLKTSTLNSPIQNAEVYFNEFENENAFIFAPIFLVEKNDIIPTDVQTLLSFAKHTTTYEKDFHKFDDYPVHVIR